MAMLLERSQVGTLITDRHKSTMDGPTYLRFKRYPGEYSSLTFGLPRLSMGRMISKSLTFGSWYLQSGGSILLRMRVRYRAYSLCVYVCVCACVCVRERERDNERETELVIAIIPVAPTLKIAKNQKI